MIDFVLENIEVARSATPEDLEACQGALSELHSHDIKHGDINKHNFLAQGSRVVLIDFEAAKKCSEKEELEEEYQRLEQSLRDLSGRGGTSVIS